MILFLELQFFNVTLGFQTTFALLLVFKYYFVVFLQTQENPFWRGGGEGEDVTGKQIIAIQDQNKTDKNAEAFAHKSSNI